MADNDMSRDVNEEASGSPASSPSSILHTIYHIYPRKTVNKRITRTLDPKKENPYNTAKRRKQLEAKRNVLLTQVDNPTDLDSDAFYLKTPCLAFHDPPRVLYSGASDHRQGTPRVIITGVGCWTTFKLQYGAKLSHDGVIDPRGVVSWKHNGGSAQELKADDTRLKGYKVRNWRLWGENGKAYVNTVRANRKAGRGPDPDVIVDDDNTETKEGKQHPVCADGVVYLKWEKPLSRYTRQYHFSFGGVDFYWKGTKSVGQKGFQGLFVRYSHLKLIARLPDGSGEVCLATYASSLKNAKNGRFEVFDEAILSLAEDYMPTDDGKKKLEKRDGAEEMEKMKIEALKGTVLYHIIVATALCMIGQEKEKRDTLVALFASVTSEGVGAIN